MKNTDARKAAIAHEQYAEAKDFLNQSLLKNGGYLTFTNAVLAMLEFAQSRPATLDEVSDEKIKEAADESYNNTSVWHGGYFTPFQAGVRWRESLSEQPEAVNPIKHFKNKIK